MNAIRDILTALGTDVDELEINESIRLEREAFEDLVIEKVGDDRLSVAQVYTQRGDLMRDPEVVFDTSQEEWVPVMYQHDPREYKESESGLPDVKQFCDDMWDSNLRAQGFVDAARERATA